MASVPGTVQASRLNRERGQVAYEVTVQPVAGGRAMDVQVDATNGSVQKSEPAASATRTRRPTTNDEHGNSIR